MKFFEKTFFDESGQIGKKTWSPVLRRFGYPKPRNRGPGLSIFNCLLNKKKLWFLTMVLVKIHTANSLSTLHTQAAATFVMIKLCINYGF